MPSGGLNYGTVPGHPRTWARTTRTHPWVPSQQSAEAFSAPPSRLRWMGTGRSQTSLLPSLLQLDPRPVPTCPPAHLPTKVSRAYRVYGAPLKGTSARCKVQGECSDAGADPGTFRHTILGIETKLSSRSITLQTFKDPAVVAVICKPSLLARSLCFASLRFAPTLSSSSLFCEPPNSSGCPESPVSTAWFPNPCTKHNCGGRRHPSSLFLLSLICAALCLYLLLGAVERVSLRPPRSFLSALVRPRPPREAMEFSDIPIHHRHHQSRHSKHQSRHRKPRVAHTARALGSDQKESLTRWPTREERAHGGNKQGLVDTWLEDIETPRLQRVNKNESLSEKPSPKARSRPRSTYRLRSPSPRRAFHHNSHNGPASKASPRQNLRERNRLRDLVQNGAVLDLCDQQDTIQVQPEVSQIPRSVSAGTESNYEREKKRPHMGSEDSVVSVVSAAQYHFEKKARHKTRSDRYDTTRVHEPRKAGKKKRKKTVDQSKGDGTRRGGDFSSAREVMDNFNSKSILSDRITVSAPPPG